MKNYAIILASGVGSRYGGSVPKQFSKIAGKSILEHTIEVFEKATQINEIILVILPESRLLVEEILLKNHYKKITKILNGGETRKESSYIGVMSIDDEEANVLIHDCARPFLSQDVISRCIQSLDAHNAIDVAIPTADTIIEISSLGFIHNIPKRDTLMRGQTPQCFKLSLIKKAHQMAINDDDFTDDCGLILKYNLGEVFVVEGESENIKITYAQDIVLADKLFQTKTIFAPETDLSKLSLGGGGISRFWWHEWNRQIHCRNRSKLPNSCLCSF
ncbi:2-C-methyl-D-erythritol 4-phosphate cytidylyltransferase [Helicobacter sp. MIT 05-5293]|uniref:2-C-methyl-D-erythritol 4-phosphate cytidylyltransferase n=1 Tax=Helicobacter sp. MIT 05-5293 TaxID=1548149 RepID=UPI0018F6696B|nr:2-C-methyl-D-erythritol 4-phosphate cytidylyltransferase [Helicobacter sp. MIT 05-5293]